MISAVADTHAVLWFLSNDVRLSQRAQLEFQNALAEGQNIGISSISLVEVIYLVEKGRITPHQLQQLIDELQNSASLLLEVPVSLEVAQVLTRVAYTQVPDMPDRIIAATAVHLGVPVISRDRKIVVSAVTSIW